MKVVERNELVIFHLKINYFLNFEPKIVQLKSLARIKKNFQKNKGECDGTLLIIYEYEKLRFFVI